MLKVWTMIFLLFLIVTGCSVEKPEQIIEIKGSLNANANHIRLFGESNIIEDAVIKLVLLETDTSKEILEEKVKVNKVGKFNWTAKRPDKLKEYELNVLFLPELQPETIQDYYGTHGEFIKKKSLGAINYEIDEEEYTGIKLYSSIAELDYYRDGVGATRSTSILFSKPNN